MAAGNNMTNAGTPHHKSFSQNHVDSIQNYPQQRRSQCSDWTNGQTDGYEVQYSSSIPQKRSGSSASFGMESGSKRPSIVGPPIPFH